MHRLSHDVGNQDRTHWPKAETYPPTGVPRPIRRVGPARGVRGSADEEVEVAADLVHVSLIDRAELVLDAAVGQGPDLLGHCV